MWVRIIAVRTPGEWREMPATDSSLQVEGVSGTPCSLIVGSLGEFGAAI